MKAPILTSVMLLGLTSSVAMAGGYRCSSQCVVINTDQFKVYYLDPIEVEAGYDRPSKVFKLLTKACKESSRAAKLGDRGLVVNGFWWRSEQDQSQEHSSSHSYEDHFGASETAPNRRYSRKYAYSIDVGFGVAMASSKRVNDIHALEVHPDPATSGKNCQYDKEISQYAIPYSGKKGNLQGD
jgi:hypothetical protein